MSAYFRVTFYQWPFERGTSTRPPGSRWPPEPGPGSTPRRRYPTASWCLVDQTPPKRLSWPCPRRGRTACWTRWPRWRWRWRWAWLRCRRSAGPGWASPRCGCLGSPGSGPVGSDIACTAGRKCCAYGWTRLWWSPVGPRTRSGQPSRTDRRSNCPIRWLATI